MIADVVCFEFLFVIHLFVLNDALFTVYLRGIAPQYLGPLNYVADLPGRRPLRSAGTNRLAVPPVKLTTVANQPGFPGCRPTDMERSANSDLASHPLDACVLA